MKKFAKLKLVVLFCVLLLATSACGKKEDTAGKTPDKKTEDKKKNTPKPTEPVSDDEEDGDGEDGENPSYGEPFDVEGYLARADELAGQMPGNASCGQFVYDATLFQLPLTEQDILDAGFQLSASDVEAARKLPANSTRGVYFDKTCTWTEPDGTEKYYWFGIMCHFKNDADKETDIGELKCIGINLAQPNDSYDFSRFILPKGIEYRVSTVQDVLDAYGEPADMLEGENQTYMEFHLGSYTMKLTFSSYFGGSEYRDYTTDEKVLTHVTYYWEQ